MNTPIRVALVTGKYPPEYSGAGLRSHNSYLRLLQACPALDLHVLCSGLEQRTRREYNQDGIPVRRIRPFVDPQSGRAAQALAGWGEALQTFAWLQRQQPSLIHVVGASAVTAAAITWARLRKVPLLIELVNAGSTPEQSLPLVHHMWRPDLRHGTAIITISEALTGTCRSLGLGGAVWTRPNPVDVARFHPALEMRPSLRERLTPFSREDRVLVTVGKFMPLKNQIFLLDVLQLLPQCYKLVMAGPLVQQGPWVQRDQEYMQRLRQRIEELGLGKRVHLVTGFVAADEYIKLGDVYLLPSLSEGLGTPMLESLACAIPVIANAGVPALCQWIRDGVNGFLRSLDAEQWSQAVGQAEDIPESSRLEEAKRIHEVAATEVIDRRFLALLRSLAASDTTRPFSAERAIAAA